MNHPLKITVGQYYGINCASEILNVEEKNSVRLYMAQMTKAQYVEQMFRRINKKNY